jgi:hypothetical protein
MAVLFLATAILILPLFRINYLDNWMSIEGTFISNARYIRDHWPHPSWHALWYCGTRFDYTYAPGTPYAAAIASMLFRVDPARGYHIYIAFMYCLGIAGIYYLARTGTGSRGYAWLAASGAALLSPVFAFLKQYRLDSLNWAPERLNVLVKWGEGPHMCALSFILFALAFSTLAFRGARRWTIAAASICYTLVVLNDLYGALALAIFFPLLVWSQAAATPVRFPWQRAAGIVLLTTGLCAWWLTPSFLLLTKRNLKLVALPGNGWSMITGSCVVLLFGAVSWRAGRKRKASAWTLFISGLLLFFAVNVLGQIWFGFRIVGEPVRFLPELDIALILVIAEGIRQLWLTKRWAAVAVTALCLAFSANYLSSPWAGFQADHDYRRRVEYRITEWIAGNLPGSRVFSFGSIGYWYTAWRDLPDATGGSDQGMQTLMPALARFQIRNGDKKERDIAMLQSLGVDALIMNEANSQEIYHEPKFPRGFMGVLPVIYNRDGDIIYRVPRRPGLARVVDEQRISRLSEIPWNNEDGDQLRAYADTLEAIDSPAAYERPAIDEIQTSAVTAQNQSVLVQESFDPGWHAWVDGMPVKIETDIMGFMRVRTSPGPHRIRFVYKQTPEARIAAGISIAALVAAFALACDLRTGRRHESHRMVTLGLCW